jgi:hypothetical protein
MRIVCLLILSSASAGLAGCHSPSVTSVPMSPWNRETPDGIPFYLPKPLLVVSKNVRHIDEAKIGLTNPSPTPNAFDNQASYADLKANVTAPGMGSEAATGLKATIEDKGINLPEKFSKEIAALDSTKEQMTPPTARIQDGIIPDSFFTYQIVFVPDLSQKYGLRVRGNRGEVRAAMNLVNGWMYTGMGPYYLKDSSTAQNRMAVGVAMMFAGRAASQVLGEVTGIAGMSAGGGGERAPAKDDELIERFTRLTEALKQEEAVPAEMCHYAEVYVYEPSLMPDGTTDWQLIAHHDFTRDYFLPPATGSALKELLPSIFGIPTTPSSSGSEQPGRSIESPGASAPQIPGPPMPLTPANPEDLLPPPVPPTTAPPPQ